MLNLVMLALICSKLFLGRVLVDWGRGRGIGFGEETAKLKERNARVRRHFVYSFLTCAPFPTPLSHPHPRIHAGALSCQSCQEMSGLARLPS